MKFPYDPNLPPPPRQPNPFPQPHQLLNRISQLTITSRLKPLFDHPVELRPATLLDLGWDQGFGEQWGRPVATARDELTGIVWPFKDLSWTNMQGAFVSRWETYLPAERYGELHLLWRPFNV